MPEPLIKVQLFCEWETLFNELPPAKLYREVYHQLCAKGVKFIFLTDEDPAKVYSWCGKQYFPEAIISPTGILGYKGRDINPPAIGATVKEGFVDSVSRFIRLASINDDILIKTALLHKHAETLAPLMDLVILDNRAEEPEGLGPATGRYRCEKTGEDALLEWAGMMTQRLKFFRSKQEKDEA